MQGSLNRLLIMFGVGGISIASILAAINAGAHAADSGKSNLWAATLFIVALLLFIKTQNFNLLTTTAEIDAIIRRMRVRLMDQVRHSELLALDGIGRAEIVAAITKETAALTLVGNALGFVVQGSILILFVAIYVAYLSLLAFALSVIIIGVAGALFHSRNRRLAEATHEVSKWENRLFNRLMDLLDGFKEVRLNSSRSEDLYGDIAEVSRTAANIKIRTQAETFRQMVLLQSSMYAMLGSMVFAVPLLSRCARRSLHLEDRNRSGVHYGHVCRPPPDNPHTVRRKYCSGQYWAPGGTAAGDRRRRARRRCRTSETVRANRDVRHRLQLRREVD